MLSELENAVANLNSSQPETKPATQEPQQGKETIIANEDIAAGYVVLIKKNGEPFFETLGVDKNLASFIFLQDFAGFKIGQIKANLLNTGDKLSLENMKLVHEVNRKLDAVLELLIKK